MIKTTTFLLLMVFLAGACNYVTVSPRTKSQIRREQPSLVLLSAIADFRNETGNWPLSKEAMMYKGKQYKSAWEGFRFQSCSFKVKDADKMYFHYWDHPGDEASRNTFDLNSYSGVVKFYKKNDRFVWKIK